MFPLMRRKSSAAVIPTGEDVYLTPGTYSWVCPTDVTAVSVVCVGAGGEWQNGQGRSGGGGGALAYKNNIPVTPGTSYTVVVGGRGGSSQSGADGGDSYFGSTSTCWAEGGKGHNPPVNNIVGDTGYSSFVGDGGGRGGGGGISTYTGNEAGGGGAGGYSGDGGVGQYSGESGTYRNLPTAGAGGGGGGGGCPISGDGKGGGGVGLYGIGSNGTAGDDQVGGGGSGGASASGADGGAYGGGSGAANPGIPGTGAVRIIYGTGRSFPNNAA